MTREEAEKIVKRLGNLPTEGYYRDVLKVIEALGLIKFNEPKNVKILCSYERKDLGVIRVEEWPEGLVLWVGGVICWKSWK